MNWLSDKAIERLRSVPELPDLSATRYRRLDELGRGGMGTVYLAEDCELQRQVAIKVLRIAAAGDAAERMLREARILARLEHPGIVPVHDVGLLPDGRVFYAMKRVRGSRLADYAGQLGSLPERLRLFGRICEAVAFAHAQGVIHRDLKPENIMVGEFGEALVMDWGVAKLVSEAAQPDGDSIRTERGAVIGTPAYMAPEQAQGRIDLIGERSDVYSLGAILRFLLANRSPGEHLPRAIDEICRKAHNPELEQRYATVKELSADVARFVDRLPVLAYREGIFERGARLASRHRTAILLVIAYLAMRSAILFFSGR